MKKSEFLSVLRSELEKYKINDIDNIIEYYDELIEDKIEGSKKNSEEEIVDNLGCISDIVKNIILEQRIEAAEEKPTISNGFKAWVTALSVMSLPILIPLIMVIGALAISAVAIVFSFIMVVIAVIFVLVAAMINFIIAFANGNIPLESFIFAMGASLTLFGCSLMLLKWLAQLTKQFVLWPIGFLKEKLPKRKEVSHE